MVTKLLVALWLETWAQNTAGSSPMTKTSDPDQKGKRPELVSKVKGLR